jgi:hypothetical protein
MLADGALGNHRGVVVDGGAQVPHAARRVLLRTLDARMEEREQPRDATQLDDRVLHVQVVRCHVAQCHRRLLRHVNVLRLERRKLRAAIGRHHKAITALAALAAAALTSVFASRATALNFAAVVGGGRVAILHELRHRRHTLLPEGTAALAAVDVSLLRLLSASVRATLAVPEGRVDGARHAPLEHQDQRAHTAVHADRRPARAAVVLGALACNLLHLLSPPTLSAVLGRRGGGHGLPGAGAFAAASASC